ncbi:unnamed protein product [Moneuplotes crassus]|uniref:Uncharacterized protein n=1 Tax=Euplotes crassus TaxID=5936 RepID=A0AAD1X8Y8_EUPCR|nr:unnamed protein product [Moneuplotes crassus]
MFFDPDHQKPKISKFTKNAMKFREDLYIGVSIVEKILRRTHLLAYSRDMDQYVQPYATELFLYHLRDQICVMYTPYNINIDYPPNHEQIFSSQMCASGIINKIMNSPEGKRMNYLLHDEEDEEPQPALIDRQAGFNLPRKDHSCILEIESSEEEIVVENDKKKISVNKRAAHLKQPKKRPLAVELPSEEGLQLNDNAIAMKDRILEEKRKIQEERDRRDHQKKIDRLMRRQIIERNKELAKKKYTYDFNGNFLFIKKLNGDKLPKKTINLPYKWHLTNQELLELEQNEKKKKAASRTLYVKDKPKPKPQKLYKLPQSFSSTIIPSKFEYLKNGNYDVMKPQVGVTLVQNGKRKKSQPIRTSPKSSLKDDRSSIQKDISIDDLDEYTATLKMPDFEEIDPIFHTQPDKILTKISSDHHVRVVDRKAVKWMITTPDKNTPLNRTSKNSGCKSKNPKINIANLQVNPRVNTANKSGFRHNLRTNKSHKHLSRRSSRKSFTERFEEADILSKIKNPHTKVVYQAAFGLNWGQERGAGPGLSEKELAKRPKSRQIGTSVSARNLLHSQRINLKTQNNKKRVALPQPPIGQTIGHGLITKYDL